MDISATPQTKIELVEDTIDIAQKNDQGEDQLVYFHVLYARTIAAELVRLADEYEASSK